MQAPLTSDEFHTRCPGRDSTGPTNRKRRVMRFVLCWRALRWTIVLRLCTSSQKTWRRGSTRSRGLSANGIFRRRESSSPHRRWDSERFARAPTACANSPADNGWPSGRIRAALISPIARRGCRTAATLQPSPPGGLPAGWRGTGPRSTGAVGPPSSSVGRDPGGRPFTLTSP